MIQRVGAWLLVVIAAFPAFAQDRSIENVTGAVRLRIESSLRGKNRAVPAVMWLEPVPPTPAAPFEPRERYMLVQKNRTFFPHLQVIPVGSVVQFPNEDPFFHNVFSLFDGKRFDLGLYEAGSSKSETFSRIGVSYIFCNIHPEMSAIIIALDTSLYAIADGQETFTLNHIPPGDYTLHLWIEGVPQSVLDRLGRSLRVPPHAIDLGVVQAPLAAVSGIKHENMYGHPYPQQAQPPY